MPLKGGLGVGKGCGAELEDDPTWLVDGPKEDLNPVNPSRIDPNSDLIHHIP